MALTSGPNLGLLVNGSAGETHYAELMRFLRGVDALVQATAESITTTTPPGSPSNGVVYVVPSAGATGAWSGLANRVVRWSSTANAWESYVPKRGWLIYVRAESAFYRFETAGWDVFSGGGGGGGPGSLSTETLPVATATHDLDNANRDRYHRFTFAGAKTLNVRANATHAITQDAEFHLRVVGTGDLTIAPAGGVTINAPFGGTLVMSPGMTATLKRVAVNVFDLLGQTVAA